MIKMTITNLDQLLLHILKKHDTGISRFNICEKLKLSKYKYINHPYRKYSQTLILHNQRTTIYDTLNKLEQQGKIIRYHFLEGNIGRPITLWKLNPNIEFLY